MTIGKRFMVVTEITNLIQQQYYGFMLNVTLDSQ